MMNGDRFGHPTYLIRRKVLKLFGGAFHIYGPDGQLVLYSRMKAFKLREDIRLFADEDMTQELITIAARGVIDFGMSYDVIDAKTRQPIGVLRRKGLKSMVQDEWAIMDPYEREIALLKEDSLFLALVRRFASNLVPQHFSVTMNGEQVCTLKQNFNPFVQKLTVNFTADQGHALDRRLGLAAGVLIAAVEGRQTS